MPWELQSIKVHSNHFMSCSLLTEGFKVFFFSDLCWMISEWQNMFFQPRGSSMYLINSKAIFQVLSRSFSDLEWRENSVQHATQEFQFRQHLALQHLSGYSKLSFQLKVEVYHALSSIFWQALSLLSQSLNSSSSSLGSDHVAKQTKEF